MLPAFQPQNPAINGYWLGWASCTAYSGAMAASYDRQVKTLVTGEQVRRWTGDTSGGTNLAQIDQAITDHTAVELDVRYRYPYVDFVRRVKAGQGAILQGWYEPVANIRFDAGGGFTGNHAFFVPPGFGVMDPLADGRRTGIYKYHGEVYPQWLLQEFSSRLNIGSGRYVALGAGLVYAAFTRAVTATTVPPLAHRALIPSGAFWLYDVDWANGIVKPTIPGRHSTTNPGAGTVPTLAARSIRWTGHSNRSLLRITKGIYLNKGIDSQYEV